MKDVKELLGPRMPAEWEKHDAVWLAWPSHSELWQENLPDAQSEFVGLCEAICGYGPEFAAPPDVSQASAAQPRSSGPWRAERLEILAPTDTAFAAATSALKHLDARIHRMPFGDIWLRDTAPLFVQTQSGLRALTFEFNGWGEKYLLPHDNEVASRVAAESGVETASAAWVLEGGSVEFDSQGLCLTTRQCLLNKNRNPNLSQSEIEKRLACDLGAKKTLWLGDGLLNDHTDGHIDTIARFYADGKVVCMKAESSQDPNFAILEKIASDLRAMADVSGRPLHVTQIPSPGQIYDEDDRLMPASYVNFYIGNASVVVPTYGSPFDALAVAAIAELFPNHVTVGRLARAILSGGGAFHCITQQQPQAKET